MRRMLCTAAVLAVVSLGAPCVLLATPAAAAECREDETRCRQVEELVALLRYEQSIDYVRGLCIEALAGLHPDNYARSPDRFFGVSPGSRAWQEVLSAFETFRQEACGDEAFRGQLLERYRYAWQAALDEPGMDAALAFPRGRNGREFARAMFDVQRQVAREYDRLSRDLRARAFDLFWERVRQIARSPDAK